MARGMALTPIHKKQGVGSYVGEFSGDGIVLKFDYGRYSNDLSDAVASKYLITQEQVGHKSTLSSSTLADLLILIRTMPASLPNRQQSVQNSLHLLQARFWTERW